MTDRMKWRVLPIRKDDGAMCMAIDKALITSVSEGRSPPTIRVYQWAKETISFAKGTKNKVSSPLAETLIDNVERPSGGKALYHHPDDPTYCIVAPWKEFLTSYSEFNGINVTNLYRICLSWEVSALDRMGIYAVHSEDQKVPSDSCLIDRGRHNVVIGGKKISGSAMADMKGAFLIHGSIFYNMNLAKVISAYSDFGIQMKREDLEQSATWIREYSRISSDDAIKTLLNALVAEKDYNEGELTPYELELINEKKKC